MRTVGKFLSSAKPGRRYATRTLEDNWQWNRGMRQKSNQLTACACLKCAVFLVYFLHTSVFDPLPGYPQLVIMKLLKQLTHLKGCWQLFYEALRVGFLSDSVSRSMLCCLMQWSTAESSQCHGW